MIFRIDLKILLFLIIFYFTKQIEIYTIIMFFTSVHELSHLLVGLCFKMQVKQITIMPIGLSIEFIKKENIEEIKKIIVAMAGPISNLLIVCFTNLIGLNYELIIYSNVFIAIFNLLPIYPLDGGRILNSILHLVTDKRKAIIYMNAISNIVLFCVTLLFSILIYYFKNIAVLFIVIYLWYMVLKENRINKQKKKLENLVFANSPNLTK